MKMNSLSNLLAHEIVDLYSAETQIIQALPKMIEKAQNQELKKALKDHLKITEQQKTRLEKVHKLLKQEDDSSDEELGGTQCKGMKGLIEEGKKSMEEDMDPDVMDAAIIACAQKIEHYEISGYGTSRAFARELGYNEIEKLLKQTLDEEYQADDLLTSLALGDVNLDAEHGGDSEEEISVRKLPANRKSLSGSNGSSKRSSSGTKKSSTSGGRSKTSTASKSKSSGGSRTSGKSSRSK